MARGAVQQRLKFKREEYMSYHDTARNVLESFFHGLMLGIVVGLKEYYQIKSNRESGLGRYDVALIPKKDELPGIIMEFKAKYVHDSEVDALAKVAVQQMSELEYQRELQDNGIVLIKSLGIGFNRRKARILNVD